jgi:DNA-binding transcriptional regulator YiaG
MSKAVRHPRSEQHPSDQRPPDQRPKQQPAWDAARIKSLREFLQLTQTEMAEELQVRQQTVSEWETGQHTPHRSTQKVLSMVAERAGFDDAAHAQPATRQSNAA